MYTGRRIVGGDEKKIKETEKGQKKEKSGR